MAKFDKALWAEIAPRFGELIAGKKVEKFLAANDLLGLKWRQVVDARQGMSVETLVKVCIAFDVSPTWLLFGKGRRMLSDINEPVFTMEGITEETVEDLRRLIKKSKPRPKQEIFDLLRRMADDAKTQVSNDSSVPVGPVKPDPADKVRRGSK